MIMTSTHSSKGSRQNISSKHSGTDALNWEGSRISKNDALSWEGSSIKTRDKTSSHAVHQPAKSKGSTKTTSSDHIRKSVSQYSDVTPSASSVCEASTHISTPQSKVTAQLLEQDNILYKLTEEYPVLADYFQEMKLDKQLPQMLADLFKLKQLPFSPFCQLICELRPTMERYQQANINFSQLSNLNINEIVLPWPGSVLAKCDNCIWGIPSLLQWIRPQFLLQYDWLVNNLEESFRPVYQLNYEIKPIICLSGATVFVGGLLSQLSVVDIRLEVIITGESEQKAIELFARQIVRDLKSTATITEHNFHLLIDVPLKDRRWNIDSINSNEDEFRELIEKSTQDNTSIIARSVFAMNEDYTSYQFGIKAYTLNFVKSTATDSQVKVFTDNQYRTLYSSVVLGEAAGKHYTTLFTPGQRPTRKLQAVSTRLSINQLGKKDKQDTRPTAINQAEVDKLVELWKKEIAENGGVTSLLLTLHKLILLYCVQHDYNDQLLAQIYNISHSPSYWLLLATSGCGYLLKVVHSKADKNGNIVKALFSQLKKMLSNVFNPLLWEQTSDMKSYHSDLANQINQIDMATITADNHEELAYLYHYLQGIILGTLQHMLSACPMIKKTIVTIHKSFPEIRKHFGSNSKQLQNHKSKDQLNKKSKPTFKLFRSQQQHNDESQNSDLDDDVVTDDYTDSFIDVDQLQQYSKFPLPVAKEAILLQYAVDSRIDECVQAFLSELLMCVALPRNPYSTLVSLLKQYHWRLCLYQQTDTELKDKLVHNKEQLDVPDSFLYRLTNEELFGCAPVLGVVSSAHLMPLVTTILEDYRNHKYTRVKGLLKVKTSACLTGPVVLYGSILPYVFDVTVHEHYLITSTMKNHDEQSSQLQLAIALMSEIVTTNVTQLIKLHGLICTEVRLGSLSWSVDDVTNKQNEFTIQLHDTLTNKQAIIFKSFYLLDGCYVIVYKHYCMHFINGEVGNTIRSYDTFYPANFQSYYISVFTNRDKALDLYELWFADDPDPVASSNMKNLTSELDKLIGQYWSHGKFLEAYRSLLVRSLVQQQWNQLGEAWNMLHSMAADLEYIQYLCNILQQLALLPPTSSPNDNVISTMINKLSNRLQLLLTKASKMFITEASLLDHIKVILDPYQVSAKLVTGKEASETFSKIFVLIMPLMSTVFQDIHALCKENNQLLVSLNIETERHIINNI